MVEKMDTSQRKVLARPALAALAGAWIMVAAPASAQEAPPAPPPIVVPPGQPPTPAYSAVAPVTTGDDTALSRVPTELVEVHPGGVTADLAGVRAAATSWNAKASLESLRGAAARVDEAWAGFLPRLSGVAKYTRLSNFTSPPFFSVPGNLVATTAGPGGALLPGAPLFSAPVTVSVPFFEVNNWLLQGTITVPISDYFLSIDQKYTAATRSEEAARWDVMSARATALSNGKIEYYTWLRNRGAVIVAVQSLNDQKTHLRDARNQFAVGNASKADVLRAETAVSAAELTVEQATESLRRHREAAPGRDALVRWSVPAARRGPRDGHRSVRGQSPENDHRGAQRAARDQERRRECGCGARAIGRRTRRPMAGPERVRRRHLRQPQPARRPSGTEVVRDVGRRRAGHLVAERHSDRERQRERLRVSRREHRSQQGTTPATVSRSRSSKTGRASARRTSPSTRARAQLASAEEAYRVQRELFNNGRGTSTTLTDAETDLTRARLTLLNAKADARIARIRLDHALGRDVRPAAAVAGSTR